ncbi:putative gustatory receptor 59f [Aricia agestis]|uniref:putative gustatory receptor 59f n=1 Tax=Aricia agestis TaxID=91739 RepID=UPI001C204A61|nr:putative gustatory receptor 59f [Aricia agestis]
MNSVCGISHILLMLSFLILHIQEIIESSEAASMTEGLLTQLNYMLELNTLILFCLVAYYCTFTNREEFVSMLNTVISTWLALPTTDTSQKILRRLKSQINVVMYILALVFVLQISVNFTRSDSVWKIILVTITFDLPQMIQFVYLAFYFAYVMLVIALLSNINAQCRLLASENSILFVHPKTCSMVRKMELVYIKAIKIKSKINRAFQGPILATTLQCFHSIVSEAHIIYHGVVSRSTTTHDLVNCSVWIMYQILKIYSLSYSGNLLKMEALKIGQTLHSIPTEKQDTRCLAEIQHFATLMNFQGSEITLYGYFPVDATLMFNMLASAMMYMIILVQFDKSD